MSQTKKELKRFIVAGFSAVATDLISYYLLLNILTHSPAKGISFILGTIVAYFINKYWTFEKTQRCYKEIGRFATLYATTLTVNVVVNKISLVLFPTWVFFAFLAATGVSTVLNFIGQKWWVFK